MDEQIVFDGIASQEGTNGADADTSGEEDVAAGGLRAIEKFPVRTGEVEFGARLELAEKWRDCATAVFLDHEFQEVILESGADREVLALVIGQMRTNADVLSRDKGIAVARGA